MIFKQFQLNKLNLDQYNFFLFYGKNEGLQNEIIERYFIKDFKGEVIKYDENEILNNIENIISEILNKSLFSSKKILIISRTSEKSLKFIKELQEKNLNDLIIIYKSNVLEKKSKLRNLFEKDKNLVIVPFYEDDQNSLLLIINNFLIKNKIKISRETINLLIERASGSRVSLNMELEKIYNYSFSEKNIEFETVKKLTNLAENVELNELVDQYLIKNTKRVTKILNENNYSDEDCILILRTILIKSKRLMGIIERNIEQKNIDSVIMNTRPPIFWKDKENVKKQVKTWNFSELKNKIYQISEIENLIKNNTKNSLNIVSDFMINY
tara:strand:+ start:72 stop:1049 length:978 start_codon:yes stop_codon:yes gene_type:complete